VIMLATELGDQLGQVPGGVRKQLVKALLARLRLAPAHLAHGLVEQIGHLPKLLTRPIYHGGIENWLREGATRARCTADSHAGSADSRR
jgi:hypothetical protein